MSSTPTTVRVAPNEAQILKAAQRRILQAGLDRLESVALHCTDCGRLIAGARFTSDRWSCQSCGHDQIGLRIGEDGAVTLGSTAAIGAVLILNLLSTGQNGSAARSGTSNRPGIVRTRS